MLGNIAILGDQNTQGLELKEALKKSTAFVVRMMPLTGPLFSILSKFEPDLVVLNPRSSAAEVIETYYALKKEAMFQDLPVAVVLDEAEMRSADLPGGIQEILVRPIRLPEAVMRLKHLLKRTHRIDQKNCIDRGKLSIDVSKYEVRIDERKIDLTYTEFELLKFLASNPGTVFTREVLLNKVWGYEYYGGTRTVDVHVRRLRSKIESRAALFIETVRNIGYKFISEEE